MYKLKKEGKTIRNKTFETYERARQAARRMIRAKEKDTPEAVKNANLWDTISRNPPSIRDWGYEIVKANSVPRVGLTD